MKTLVIWLWFLILLVALGSGSLVWSWQGSWNTAQREQKNLLAQVDRWMPALLETWTAGGEPP